jgi:hypothetical protein
LDDKEKRAMIENLYREIDLRERWNVFYTPVFFLRRILYAVVFNLAINHGCVQI